MIINVFLTPYILAFSDNAASSAALVSYGLTGHPQKNLYFSCFTTCSSLVEFCRCQSLSAGHQAYHVLSAVHYITTF